MLFICLMLSDWIGFLYIFYNPYWVLVRKEGYKKGTYKIKMKIFIYCFTFYALLWAILIENLADKCDHATIFLPPWYHLPAFHSPADADHCTWWFLVSQWGQRISHAQLSLPAANQLGWWEKMPMWNGGGMINISPPPHMRWCSLHHDPEVMSSDCMML